MKAIHQDQSLGELCELFGKSRQAWYQGETRADRKALFHAQVLDEVADICKDQSRIGTRKLYHLINASLAKQGLCIGRDQLFDLLRSHGLLVRRRKRYRPRLTDGNGESIYPDLRKDLAVSEINQLWSADITYLELDTAQRHCYCTLVVDEKSHKILGYHVAANMEAKSCLQALKMAVESQLPDSGDFDHSLIFHTDRGSQFKSTLFKDYLNEHKIKKSMCAAGKSSENPVSERLNGILKNELLFEKRFSSTDQAYEAISRAVYIYNQQRPHLSCGMLTPEQAHHKELGPLKRLWKGRKPRKKTNKKKTTKKKT